MWINPLIDQAAIVLRGSFNPAIFQPAWFTRHDMVRDGEARDLEISQINQELRFKTGVFDIHVKRDGFAVESLDNSSGHIRDLVVSCFGRILPHTPISALWIRRYVHFDTRNLHAVDRVRNLFAPEEPWGEEWGKMKKTSQESLEKPGGMFSVTAGQQVEFDRGDFHVYAKVEPSAYISSGTGIFIEVQNFFEFTGQGQTIQDASLGIQVLEDKWESSLKRAEIVFDQVMKLTEQ